jgi:hypothetical protein
MQYAPNQYEMKKKNIYINPIHNRTSIQHNHNDFSCSECSQLKIYWFLKSPNIYGLHKVYIHPPSITDCDLNTACSHIINLLLGHFSHAFIVFCNTFSVCLYKDFKKILKDTNKKKSS